MKSIDELVASKIMSSSKINTSGTELTWPPYSKDISEAWLVVEEMRTNGFLFDLIGRTMPHGKCYLAMFYLKEECPNLYQTGSGLKDTAPEAICEAALKAIDKKGE